jgi:hypothetical protein
MRLRCDRPLTEHEKEQIALRKNLERLRANDWQERLPMQVIHPNKKTAGVTDGPFVDMSLGLIRSTLP